LLAPLGVGELFGVYVARPAECDGTGSASYAVKVLREPWRNDPTAIAILRREAIVGSAVSHPNVVPILSSSFGDQLPYLVMPCLDGQSLASLLGAGWRPELPIALWIARQIAMGLAAIESSCGMIHGDVKPSNVIVASNGHATLIDLGFARTRDECRAAADRPVLGTLRYAAPETLTSALAADVRSDIYSLGTMLYEMLAGNPPFAVGAPADLVCLQREVKPVCIREHRPDVPRPITSLVHTMLSKAPLRRPRTLEETIDRIARLEIEWFADRVA
jgi:serine/threonine protein kinase